ncbi:MAG: hypothetical protein KAJ29_02670 [Alphaproteobacteria bacterium]|nr:hypothetical protein [Alphaproteobacteria bacterium]
MAIFKLPLSGNVNQKINPFSWFTEMTNGTFGLVNINLGRSSAPEVEQEILENVGSYGRQLGRVCAAMRVLADHLPEKDLSKEEKKAMNKFLRMMDDIDDVKESARKRYCCTIKMR